MYCDVLRPRAPAGRWSRGQRAVVAAVSGIALMGGAESASAGDLQPLTVTAHGLTVGATLGTYCLQPTIPAMGSVCGDAAYPLPVRGHLPIRPRDVIAIHTGGPVRKVGLALLRVHGKRTVKLFSHAAHRGNNGRTRWTLRLPRSLRAANVVNVYF